MCHYIVRGAYNRFVFEMYSLPQNLIHLPAPVARDNCNALIIIIYYSEMKSNYIFNSTNYLRVTRA